MRSDGHGVCIVYDCFFRGGFVGLLRYCVGGHVVSYRDSQVEMRMMSGKIRANIDIDSMSSKLIIIGV